MRMTEQVLDGNGHQLGVWLGRTHSPHDIAIVNGPNGALHHWAYWLDDWDHIRKAADTLAYNGVQIDQGPTRHGVTRGNTIYFFDPLGIRNEVFTGGYWVDPDIRDHHLDRGQVRHGPLLLRERRQPAVPAHAHVKGRQTWPPHRTGSSGCSTSRSGSPTSSCAPRTTPRSSASSRPRTTRGPRVFLKCWDEHEHHSVILRQAPTYGLDHMSFKLAEAADLDHFTDEARGGRRAGQAVRAPRAGPGLGRGDPLRVAVGAPRRARPRHGAGRQHAAEDQPAAAAAGPHRHRAAAPGPPVRHGRGRRGVHGVLHRAARVPAHRADPRQRRPPARRPSSSTRTPRTTSPSSPARTGRCTTSRSGSTTGTRSARPPTRSPTTA